MGYPRPTPTEVRKQLDLTFYCLGLQNGSDYSAAYDSETRTFTVTGTNPQTSKTFSFDIFVGDGLAAADQAVKDGLYDG